MSPPVAPAAGTRPAPVAAVVAPDPRCAVVIVTRDRAGELEHTLGRLAALPERPAIVVVDNGSRDGTPALVRRRFPGVRLVALDRDHGAAGRTIGARAVDAPYVAFCDDDSWWEPGALARGAALLDADPALGLIAGRILVGTEQALEPACAAMAASPLPSRTGTPGRSVLGFVACGTIVRKRAFLAVGGFDARLGIGAEEQLLAADLAAAGWALVYRDDILAYHHPSQVRARGDRRAIVTRNDLWFAWLRRRPAIALGRTLAAARLALRDPAARTGLRQAVGGLRWVVAERRAMPPWLEAQFAALDAG